MAGKRIDTKALREAIPLIRELRSREAAKDSLLEWCRQVAPDEPPAEHHRLLIENLEAVERGDIKRLMVFWPPGSSKTSYASIRFPAWYIGRNPKHNIIGASHSSTLAEDISGAVRSLVGGERFRPVFGFGLSKTSSARDEWANELASGRQGIYYAVGVDKSVTGRRASGAIIDDPVKGRQDADSEAVKRTTRRWYVSDLRSRLKPDAWLVIIQTRWAEDDLAGGILPEDWNGESGDIVSRDGETWRVVCLPAIAEENDTLGRKPGEPLWPEYFGEEHFQKLRAIYEADGDLRGWSALYQQRPMPEEGDYFRREWFRFHSPKPSGKTVLKTPDRKEMRIYGASDYAASQQGDYTVHGIFGVDEDDNIYVLDWYRERATPMEWVERFCDMALKWKPAAWIEEKGPIAVSVAPFLDKRIRERKAYVFRDGLASVRDKQSRAQSVRGRMQMGKVYFPERAAWMDRLEREILTFPAAKNDDQVDVMSLIGRYLGRMGHGTRRVKAEKPKYGIQHVTMDRLWTDHGRNKRRIGVLI